MARRKRIIHLKLTEAEANALIDAGNSGIADMHDSQEDDQLKTADVVDVVLDRLGQLMRDAKWADDQQEETEC